MNLSIAKLAEIGAKKERKIIGLMSGTSMDGLDIALCLCSGNGNSIEVKLLNFTTATYQDDFRTDVKNIFSKRDVDLQKVCLLNEYIGIKHAELILKALKKWNINADEIDLIASHGQTIFHAPQSLHGLKDYPNGTLQIGDGDHIAVKTGIITLSDFRQKHLAAGGEGAPLAVYGDYLMFSKKEENRIMLNIGGIANFTYLPADGNAEKVFSTDVGPGNTLMDQFIQKNYPGLYYDKDAEIAKSGNLNEQLLKELMNSAFFKIDFPKTTGPELFNLSYLLNAQRKSGTESIRNEDVLASICHFSALVIANSIKKCFSEADKSHIYMSGGGMHNPLLISILKNEIPWAKFTTTDKLGIHPDAKEAVLFAVLANESVAGEPIYWGKRQSLPSICMGKICLPY
ncbi:MAG: anhydro-N-acetylmuramic acid kinase [Daejeonella sp.]